MSEEHECDECGQTFTWDVSQTVEWWDEYDDGSTITVWEIDCPQCGEKCRVHQN